MRAPVLSLFVSAAAAGLAASPASAELNWQSNGVQQASHQSAARATAPRNAGPAPTNGRPQFVAPNRLKPKAPIGQQPRPAAAPEPSTATSGTPYAEQRAAHTEQVAEQAAAILHETSPPLPSYGAPRFDPGVTLVCDDGGCPTQGCDGTGECGVACDCGDPSCGFPCDGPCSCGDVGCAGECGSVCGPQGLGGCRRRGGVPLILFVPPVKQLTLSAGVQAFKGPLDESRDRGNFGFNESINAGGPMSWLPLRNVSYQIGYRATHSQLHGSDIGSTVDPHTQQFFTAGLFRRRPAGLQYGLVYDHLNDERLFSANFSQLRGLISAVNPKGQELGFLFAASLDEENYNSESYSAEDQFLFFCRKRNPCGGGEFRLFGGLSDGDAAILGGDIDLPLGDRWTMQTGFSYLIPEEQAGGFGAQEEQWNIGFNFVWHYGGCAKQSYGSPYRPLFNVADNGSFFVDDAD